MSAIVRHRQARPHLELKTRSRFCPVRLCYPIVKKEDIASLGKYETGLECTMFLFTPTLQSLSYLPKKAIECYILSVFDHRGHHQKGITIYNAAAVSL